MAGFYKARAEGPCRVGARNRDRAKGAPVSQGTLPVLPVADVGAAVDHYVDELGFEEDFRIPGPDGTLVSGQVRRGACQVMFNLNPKDADKRGGGVWLWIRMDDADIDAEHVRIRERGLTIVEEIGDRFWGDRSFAFEDRFGYVLAFNKALPKE